MADSAQKVREKAGKGSNQDEAATAVGNRAGFLAVDPGIRSEEEDQSKSVDEADKAMSIESTAWLASYGTLPTAPSNRFTVTAFDDYIQGGPSVSFVEVFSNPSLDWMMGMFDQIAVQAVTDNVFFTPTGTNPVSLIGWLEHSADGRAYSPKPATGVLPSGAMFYQDLDPQGTTALLPNYDSGKVPSLGFVRLRMRLQYETGGGPGPLMARVKVYVTCNDYREKQFTTMLKHRQKMYLKMAAPVVEAQSNALQGKAPTPPGSGC